uniref:Peroxisomal biogenesis factor n=1 Tax=Solanum tuberosum TaxID=4113 RepID=M1DXP9_SOLTU
MANEGDVNTASTTKIRSEGGKKNRKGKKHQKGSEEMLIDLTPSEGLISHPSSTTEASDDELGMLRKKRKQKASGESKDSHIAEALDKLREQTRKAVKGLESVTRPRPGVENMGNDAMMEKWVKQFEELSGSQGPGPLQSTLV